MKFGLSLSGLLQHSRDADMVQRFADVLHLVRVARDLGFDYTHASLRFGWPGTPREVVEGAIRLAAREVLPALRQGAPLARSRIAVGRSRQRLPDDPS